MTFAPSFDHVSDLHRPTPMHAASGMARMKSQANDLKFQVKTPGEMAKRVAQFLRSAHPRKTADAVAADTGISTKTISTWLDGSSCPGGFAFARLIAAYGPDFLNAVLPEPPRWLAKARDAQRVLELEASIDAQQRELEALR